MAKKTDSIHEEYDQIDGAEPRVYELGFHLDPELAQEDLKSAYQQVREKIAGAGTVIAEGEPVKVPLAYTISRMDTTGRRDFNSAFFCWIAYEADGAGHDQVTDMARTDARIIRFLDIRSSADEAKHSADLQEMFAEMASQPVEEEEDRAPEQRPETPSEPAAEPEAPAKEEAA